MFEMYVIARLRLCGETSYHSIRSVANMGILPEDGFTPLGSRLLGMCLLLRVSEPPIFQPQILISTHLYQGHDSSVTVVYPSSNAIFHVRTSSLPFVTLTWTSEEGLIAAGHDCQPTLFKGNANNGWKMIASLDDASARSATLTPTTTGSSASGGRSSIGRLNNEAFNRFKNADSRGTTAAGGAGLLGSGPPGSPGGMPAMQSGGDLLTVHQNTITSVRPYSVGADGSVSSVSTSGVDGRLVIWQVSGGVPSVAGLSGRMGGTHLR